MPDLTATKPKKSFRFGDKVVTALHRGNRRRPLIVVKVTSGRVVVRGHNNRLMSLKPYQLHKVM